MAISARSSVSENDRELFEVDIHAKASNYQRRNTRLNRSTEEAQTNSTTDNSILLKGLECKVETLSVRPLTVYHNQRSSEYRTDTQRGVLPGLINVEIRQKFQLL